MPTTEGPPRMCPDCGAPVTEELCPTCGLPIGGAAADRFWRLQSRIEGLIGSRNQALFDLRQSRVIRPDLPPPPPPPTHGDPSMRWGRTLTVRDFLLGLGVFSLVVAVVSFAVVSWDDLSTAGRVSLVVGVTSLVGGSALVLFRRQLQATAEAVTVFWAAMLVADVAAGRVLLVPDASPLLAWAVGLTVIAALLTGFGFITASRSAPSLGLIAGVVPLTLVALHQGSEILTAGAGLVALGVSWLAVKPIGLRSGKFGDAVTTGAQHMGWLFAAGAALVGLATNGTSGTLMLVVVAAGLAAGSYRARRDESPVRAGIWMAKSATLTIAAPAVLSARGEGTWTVLVASATAVIVLAVVSRTPRRERVGAVVISSGTIVLFGLLPVLALIAESLAVLLETLADPWSSSLGRQLRLSEPWTTSDRIVSFGLLGTLIIATIDQSRDRPNVRKLAGPVIGAVLVICVPILLGVPTWTAAALLLAAGMGSLGIAVVTDRYEIGAAAAILTAVGLGVSLSTPSLTIGSLTIVAIVTWVLSVRSAENSRPEHVAVLIAAAIGFTSAVVLASAVHAGWEAGAVALAVEITSGLLLLSLPALAHLSAAAESKIGKVLLLSPVLVAYEVTGAAIALIALQTAAGTGQAVFTTWALIVGAIVCAIQAIRPGRLWLVVVAAGLLALSVEVQLENAGVELVEAFVAPVVAAAVVFGWYVHREKPESVSWITWGPATAIALGASLVVALGTNPGVRPLVLPLVAVAVVVVGLVLQEQAPTIIGATVAAAIGVDFLATLASDLPSWIPFALAGLLLLVLGAKFEQSRDRAQRFAMQVRELH